jgi:hypothetical protein
LVVVVGRVRQLFLCVSVCLLVVVRENEEEKKRGKKFKVSISSDKSPGT